MTLEFKEGLVDFLQLIDEVLPGSQEGLEVGGLLFNKLCNGFHDFFMGWNGVMDLV